MSGKGDIDDQERLRDRWHDSPELLELLWKLRSGVSDPKTEAQNLSYFDSILGQPTLDVIEWLIAQGLFIRPSPEEVLRFYNVTGLKNLLRQNGLKLSGKRADLEARLLADAPELLKELAKNSKLLVLSPEARDAVSAYRAKCKAEREAMESRVLALLQERKFEDAARVVVKYEMTRVIKRGLGADWSTERVPGLAESARRIFKAKPTILSGVSDTTLEHLRAAASMLELLGTGVRDITRWIDPTLETGSHLDPISAAHMIANAASHSAKVEYYRNTEIVARVQIFGIADGRQCPYCAEMDGKVFELETVPEVPFPECSCETGCRCMISPIVENESR